MPNFLYAMMKRANAHCLLVLIFVAGTPSVPANGPHMSVTP